MIMRAEETPNKSRALSRIAIDKIPDYLLPYTTTQVPHMYSWIDHSVWRFIMSVSSDFFSDTAHSKYIDGLRETGISIERIPLVSEMDEKLKKIGWRAVAVSGFIPPSAFLEFMSLGIMPIACEIRKLENIAYTPAPDIVHEAAGHAPIVSDPDYNDYVRAYGEVAVKAIFSKKDMDLYDAIKALSDVKEKPSSTQAEIDLAQKGFEKAFANLDYVSESTQLARMSWWTIEYGLVGEPENFKLYGAGLLSSLFESYHSFDPKVSKIPLTVDCVQMGYDITRPQPQLFVATSFESARKVLEEYAATMAFKVGGIPGLTKAKTSMTTTTTVLSDALQISGTVKSFGILGDDQITTIDFEGPLQLCENDISLLPMGELPKNLKLVLGPFDRNPTTLKVGEEIIIESRWNKQVTGKVIKIFDLSDGDKAAFVNSNGNTILVTQAARVVSVFGGAADRGAFIKATWDGRYSASAHLSTLSEEQKPLNELYHRVRLVRENFVDQKQALNENELKVVLDQLDKNFTNDWLLRFEIYEISLMAGIKATYAEKIVQRLKEIQKTDSTLSELIDRGFRLLEKKYH